MMLKRVLALPLIAIGGAAFVAGRPAVAQLQEFAGGGEFRGDTLTTRGFESHIWQLAPGGRARAVARVKRGLSALNAVDVEFGDEGTWRVENGRLCFDWAGPNRRFSGCYTVERRQGVHVRLSGPAQWEGTLDH